MLKKIIRFQILSIFVLIQTACYSPVLYQSEVYKPTDTQYSKSGGDFIWGINGHPLTPSYQGYDNQYLKLNYNEQINYLKQLNLGIYRFEIHIDEKGMWNENPKEFGELIDLLNKNDIQALPVILTNPWRANEVLKGNDWNYENIKKWINNNKASEIAKIRETDIWKHYYELAFVTGKNFANEFGNQLKYYQVGNEIAYYIIKNYPLKTHDQSKNQFKENVKYFFDTYGGQMVSDFFHSEEHALRVVASAAYVSGLIDSIKENDSDAVTLVNGTRLDYGYIKFLNLLNIKYDIISWNWYSDFGEINNSENKLGVNVYQELNSIGRGKPIWISEANRTLGSYYGEPSQSKKLKEMIKEIYALPNIQSFIVYELMDRDYKNPDYQENYFGLLRSPFQFPKNNLMKPAFNTYRYTIEELEFGSNDFLFSVLKDLNGEEPSENLYNNWTQRLSQLGSYEAIVKELIQKSDSTSIDFSKLKNKKAESYRITDDYYLNFLNRTANQREKNYIYRLLKKNGSTAPLKSKIFLSEEYWQNAIWSGYERRTGFTRPAK